MAELIDGMKDVTEFLGDAFEACKDHSLIEAIAQSAPWWINGLAEELAESLPVVGFLPSRAANHFEPAASPPKFLPHALTLRSPLPTSSLGEGQGEGLRTCRVAVHEVKTPLLAKPPGEEAEAVPHMPSNVMGTCFTELPARAGRAILRSPLPPSSVGEGQGEGLRTCRVAVHGVKAKLSRRAHKTPRRQEMIGTAVGRLAMPRSPGRELPPLEERDPAAVAPAPRCQAEAGEEDAIPKRFPICKRTETLQTLANKFPKISLTGRYSAALMLSQSIFLLALAIASRPKGLKTASTDVASLRTYGRRLLPTAS